MHKYEVSKGRNIADAVREVNRRGGERWAVSSEPLNLRVAMTGPVAESQWWGSPAHRVSEALRGV